MWNNHQELEGTHSFLSPSNNSWLRYTEDKLISTYRKHRAKEEGTILHEFASQAINLGIKLKEENSTLNLFVNDCIDEYIHSEVLLYYSEYCYGTADGIKYDRPNKHIIIADLKNGSSHKSLTKFEDQLSVYAALMCLEYKLDPLDHTYEGRIYVSNAKSITSIDPEYVLMIMNKIILFSTILEETRNER